MNSQEAIFTLQAYRHHPGEASDPLLAEALEQVRQDPELARWLEQDRQLFDLLSQSLETIAVPPHLQAQILAGARLVRPVPWWQHPLRLAAAAVLMLLATAGLFRLLGPDPVPFTQFRDDMTRQLASLDHLDHLDPQAEALQHWLAEAHYPADFDLPAKLKELTAIGCRLLDWDHRKVSLVCFNVDEGRAVHLFVMDRPATMKLPPSSGSECSPCGRWQTIAWARDNKIYLLAGQQEEDLKKVL